jgi:hypothetical protein
MLMMLCSSFSGSNTRGVTPNPYPFNPKPDTRMVQMGNEIKYPIFNSGLIGNNSRYPNYPISPKFTSVA